MCCRKRKFVLPCALGLKLALSLSVTQADTLDDPSGGLRNPLAGCLESAELIYPCVSLTPSFYTLTRTTASVLPGPQLDNAAVYDEVDAALEPRQFSLSLKHGPRSPQWSALHHLGMDVNFRLDGSGAGMSVDMGGLEFNVLVEDGEEQLLETRFFLGMDTRW